MNFTQSGLTLEDMNDAKIKQLIAPIAFLVILLVVGVPGNLTVLLIYGQKYSKGVYKTIILNLAVADLTLCTFGIPFNIARVFNYYTFEGRWTCKVFTSLLIFGMLYSSNLLMLLSLHRFRQICMPMETQITLKSVRYFILICAILGIVFSLPQLAVIDLDYVKLSTNITGQICPITARHPSKYSVGYSITLLTIFLVCTLVLFVTYCLIGRNIYLRRRNKMKSCKSENQRDISHKMTRIAFTISIVFALSYIPLYFLKVAKEWFDEKDLSTTEFAILKIAERLYIVNHVANPFIYALFDNKFRGNLKMISSFKWRKYNENHNIITSKTDTTTLSTLS